MTLLKAPQQIRPINIAFKDESMFMRLLSYLLFFNPEFMTKYVTVIGKTIYFPNKEYIENEEVFGQILCHEFVHMMQAKRYGAFYYLGYLFPQILAIFSLLTLPLVLLFGNYGFIALAFLLFLLPLPAYFRMRFELEAYVASLFFVNYTLEKAKFDEMHRSVKLFNMCSNISENAFVGPSYYYTWPWGAEKELFRKVPLIISGDICDSDETTMIIKRCLDKTYE